MAILMRGGAYADFDPSKLKPREWAVVLENDPSARDGKAIYICFAAGVVKRISTYEDMYDDLLTATDDIREQYIQVFNDIKSEIEKLKSDTEGFKNIAAAKANESALSAQSAGISADTAEQKANAASISAVNAADSADDSENFSNLSKSYAIGTNGEIRIGDETDNSKYYKEECQRLMQEIERLIASVSSGGLIAAGTVPFDKLPTEPQVNYMYNISDDFVTDERFAEGAGISYSRGTNVYWTADEKWDVLTGIAVLGVKGENESVYQMGYVNITKESLGLGGLKPVAFSGSFNDLTDIPSSVGGVKLVSLRESLVSGARYYEEAFDYYSAMDKGYGVVDITTNTHEENIWNSNEPLTPGLYILSARYGISGGYTTDSRIPNRTNGFKTQMFTQNGGVGFYGSCGTTLYSLDACGGITIRRDSFPDNAYGVNEWTEVVKNTILIVKQECSALFLVVRFEVGMPYISNITEENNAEIKVWLLAQPLDLYKIE